MNTKLANLSIVSLKTTGNVEASRFSHDRTIGGRKWRGDLGELLIYTAALSDEQIESVEGYLAHKWGLAENLSASHSYAMGNAIDFHYVSSDPDVLEINGTNAIIRGGGTATVTAYAPATHTTASANPVSQTIMVTRAPLPLPGRILPYQLETPFLI